MNNFTFNVSLANAADEKGEFLVHVRITKNRKHARIGTGIHIREKDFNPKDKEFPIRKSCKLYQQYNHTITEIISELKRLAHSDCKDKEAAELKSYYENGPETLSLSQFWRDWLDTFKDDEEKYRTHEKYQNVLNKLHDFWGKDVEFDDFNIDFLEKFELWMKRVMPNGKPFNKQNTVSKTLQIVSTVVTKAVAVGKIDYKDNPFLGRRLTWEKVKKARLTESEVQKLKDLELDPKHRFFDSRNAWLLQYYFAGMRIGDALTLRVGFVEDGRLTYTMDKNNKDGSLRIIPEAQKILEHYITPASKPTDFILPFMGNEKDYSSLKYLKKQIESKTSQINQDLEIIRLKAGIEKKVTTHISRHSFASQVAKKYKEAGKKADIYSLQKALRHSSIVTTQRYMEDIDNDAADSVIDTLFGE